MTDFSHDFVNQKQNRQDKLLCYYTFTVHTRPDEFQTVLKFVRFHLVHTGIRTSNCERGQTLY
jgi:hypothetical protein